jgi:hypothetical protein
MTAYIFAGDFHENATAIDTILRQYQNDQLVLLGDYFDSRHGDAKGMAQVLTKLSRGEYSLAFDPMFVRGNHDALLLGTIDNDYLDYKTWLANGGKSTLRQLGYRQSFSQQGHIRDFLLTNYPDVIDLLRQSVYSVETDDFIAVHAGLDWNLPNPRQTPPDDMMWLRDEYLGDLPDNPRPNLLHKIIVSGHTPVQNFQSNADIMTLQADAQDTPRYLIDGGSKSGAHNGRVNVLELHNKQATLAFVSNTE